MIRRIALTLVVIVVSLATGVFLISRSDGPVFVFAGGPFRSGEIVEFPSLDWTALNALHELEMEIVGEESSLILWFSVPFVVQSWSASEVSQSPGGLPYRWLIKAVLPLGFGLLALAAISRLSRVCQFLFGARP